VLALVLSPIVVGRFVMAIGSRGDLGSTGSVASARPGPHPSHSGVSIATGASIDHPAGAPSVSDLPSCDVDDRPAPHAGYGEWARTLLDPSFRLPATHRPPDLDPAEEAGFEDDAHLVPSFVIPDLAALREAAEDAGQPIGLIAAYRSFEVQKDLFERRTHRLGPEGTIDRTARPGHSEHQLGTTVDLAASGAADVTQCFGATLTGRWLVGNAHRFGFVQSYPNGRSDVTCFVHEPWHFRYVGASLAERVHASGLTLRQFLWREDHPAG
jgi:D-alanyl-D-alanine carboxypeptidase